jgi:integrase
MMLTDYDGEKIRVVQSKTGARVWIKCHKDLKPHLDAAVAEARAAGIVNAPFLRALRGNAMGERYFATRWDAVAERTGTMQLNRQDLRRAAVIRLAEAECTVPQIAAITGHSLRQVETIVEVYFVRTYEMGEAAIAKLERHRDKLKDEQN